MSPLYHLNLTLHVLAALLWLGTISFVHDIVEGPRASRRKPGSSDSIRARRRSAWLARMNAGLGFALVWVAVRLARGGYPPRGYGRLAACSGSKG